MIYEHDIDIFRNAYKHIFDLQGFSKLVIPQKSSNEKHLKHWNLLKTSH